MTRSESGATSMWGAHLRETHSAVVVLLGDRAVKIKKPVDLGFLDFTTREQREAALRRELVLNRRMAPDVYLGLAEVVDWEGRPCEPILFMRRMPDDRRLSTLLTAGADVSDHLRRVARDVAAFHSTARTGAAIEASGTAAALSTRWADNLSALRAASHRHVGPSDLDRIEDLAMAFIAGREPLLQARIAAGLVRDGHGDLLADDIFCLDDGPRVLDCLDFDDTLRWMDVLDDVSCLAMDLERLGRRELAERFLDDYEEFSGVPQPVALRHHYTAYRAVMRAKVTAFKEDADGDEAERAGAEVKLLCDIGMRHLMAGRTRLVLVGGVPASGKSTLAARMSDELSAVLLASDRVRKELAGLAPTVHAAARFGEGIYSSASTERTYERMADQAELLLGMGESVVVDASFTTTSQRRRLRRVATAVGAELLELRCEAPDSVIESRLRDRGARPDQYSDADADIGRQLGMYMQTWPEAHVIDTNRALASTVQDALAVARG